MFYNVYIFLQFYIFVFSLINIIMIIESHYSPNKISKFFTQYI